VVACKTSPAFVDHLWEAFGPLLAGASLLLMPEGLLPLQPAAFVAALASGRATHLVAVPSLLQLLLPRLAAARAKLALRLVVSSGEPLTWRLARQLQEEALPPGCTLLNIYGSTEVAADCTAFEVPPPRGAGGPATRQDAGAGGGAPGRGAQSAGRGAEQGLVPAGRPIDGFQIAIVAAADDDGGGGGGGAALASPQVLPAGQVGEVWVAGAGLAAGYLDSPELTSSRFVQLRLEPASAQHLLLAPGALQHPGQPAARFFRTGDLGFVGPGDGLLHVLGRRDHQVGRLPSELPP
jgi:non-ribosomal peptide synthetase component F